MESKQTKKPIDIKVKIDKLMNGDSTTKAFASVTIGGAFAVHDIRISEKEEKLTVSMPFRSYKTGEGTRYLDTFHPITAEARNVLRNAVIEAYEQAMEEEMDKPEQKETVMSQQM